MKLVLWASAAAVLLGWPLAADAQDLERKMQELRKRYEAQRQELRAHFERQVKKLGKDFEHRIRDLKKQAEKWGKNRRDRGGKRRGGDELERLRERVQELEKYVKKLYRELESLQGRGGKRFREFRKELEKRGGDRYREFRKEYGKRRGGGDWEKRFKKYFREFAPKDFDWKEYAEKFRKRFEKRRGDRRGDRDNRKEHRNHLEKLKKLIEKRDWEGLKDLLEDLKERFEDGEFDSDFKFKFPRKGEKREFFRFFRRDDKRNRNDDDEEEFNEFVIIPGKKGDRRIIILKKSEKGERGCPFQECPFSRAKGIQKKKARVFFPKEHDWRGHEEELKKVIEKNRKLRLRIRKLLPSEEGKQRPSTPY